MITIRYPPVFVDHQFIPALQVQQYQTLLVVQHHHDAVRIQSAFPAQLLLLGVWHSIVVTWSPEEIVLYLDGKVMPLKANEKWLKQSRSIVKLPRGLSLQITEKCRIALNHQSSPAGRAGEGVAYDELKVYCRTLSADEIGKIYTPAAGK